MSRFLTQVAFHVIFHGTFHAKRLGRSLFLAVLLVVPANVHAETECTRLFDQLDLVEQQGGQQSEADELGSARNTYQQLGCPGVPTDPGCQELSGRINRLQNSGAGNGNLGRERQRILQQLRRAGCMANDSNRRAWEDAIGGAKDPGAFRDFYDQGGGENVWESKPGGDDSTVTFGGRSGGLYRTLCVRKCDGFFWPVSYATREKNFAGDEAACQAACPNQEVELYHHAQGQLSEEAVSGNNEPYASLANAFVFRNKYVAACGCKTDAAANAEKVRKVQELEEQKVIDAAAKRKTAPPEQQEEEADIYRSVPKPIVVDPSAPDIQDSQKATGANGLRGVSP